MTKSQKDFCSLLDEWRQHDLFCDMYLVGDDDIVVPFHKLVMVSKAYLLIEHDRNSQPGETIFNHVPHFDKHLEKSIMYVKGYNHDTLDTLVRTIYIHDFSKIMSADLKIRLCYFLLKISKLLSLKDIHIIKYVNKLEKETQNYTSNSSNVAYQIDSDKELERDESPVEKLVCHFCRKTFLSKSLLARHLTFHTNVKSLTKEDALYSNPAFGSGNDSPNTSLSSEHQITSSPLVDLLKQDPLKNIVSRKRQTCFTSKETLRRPVNKIYSHASIEEKMNGKHLEFVCVDCGKKFATCSNLTRHRLTVHWRIKRFYCPVCGQKFGQKVTLNLHLAVRHNMLGDGSLNHDNTGTNDVEQLLNRNNADVNNLSSKSTDLGNSDNKVTMPIELANTIHEDEFMKRQKWIEKTTCKVCNKKLSRPSNLNKHMLIHKALSATNEHLQHSTPDHCQSNSLDIFQTSTLNKTGKINLKPQNRKGTFVCHHCGKKFLLAEYLKKHVATIHCISKRFSCSNCPKTFASETLLKRHESIHVKKKCDRCGKLLEGQRAYNNHLKSSCGVSSFPIQDDASFFFEDHLVNDITF